jgi:hypothetical protein
MRGHAVVCRDDGQVFVHLHPQGTISMTAQQLLARRGQDRPGAAPPSHDMSAGPEAGGQGEIAFPYEFPEPGRYRIWVQVKSAGQVMTGVFDVEVGRAG